MALHALWKLWSCCEWRGEPSLLSPLQPNPGGEVSACYSPSIACVFCKHGFHLFLFTCRHFRCLILLNNGGKLMASACSLYLLVWFLFSHKCYRFVFILSLFIIIYRKDLVNYYWLTNNSMHYIIALVLTNLKGAIELLSNAWASKPVVASENLKIQDRTASEHAWI